MAVARHLHVLGATSAPRTEVFDGRPHWVIPVVALQEGVLHAVNATAPEFVSLAALQTAAKAWEGRPIVFGHPQKDGRQISANDPRVLEMYGMGTSFNSRIVGKKLVVDAYIDPVKAERVGGLKFLERLRNAEVMECSVGAFVNTDDATGVHNGKSYKGRWSNISPDHIAFLNDTIGACSVAAGCGVHRAAMHVPVNDSFISIELADASTRESVMRAAQTAEAATDTPYQQIVSILGQVRHTLATAQTAAESAQLETLRTACNAAHVAMDGVRSVLISMVPPELAVLEEHKPSASDLALLQEMHDKAVHLGANCTDVPELKAAAGAADCGCGKHRATESTDDLQGVTDMDKTARIAALIANPKTCFTADDQPMLELASDARLVALEAHVATLVTAADVAAEKARADAAEKAAADLRAAAAKTPTEDEYLARAPQSIRTLVERQKAADAAQKAELVGVLKAAQTAFTEDDLNGFEVPFLVKLAAAAQVKPTETVDYSGMGMPKPRAAADAGAPPAPDMFAAIRTAAGKH